MPVHRCTHAPPSPSVRGGFVFLLALLVSAGSPLRADSLWQTRNATHTNLIADSRARAIGDIITVVVNETTSVQNSEGKGLSKSTSTIGGFDLDAASGAGLGVHAAQAGLDLSNSSGRTLEGEATYSDRRALADRISLTVIDLLPNGNLVLAGERVISISGETRRLHISGVVRSIDIGPDNTVESNSVANLKSVLESCGAHRSFLQQGWVGRALNRVWPN